MPFVPENAKRKMDETLSTRWIGKDQKVDLFEKKFAEPFTNRRPCIAVGGLDCKKDLDSRNRLSKRVLLKMEGSV